MKVIFFGLGNFFKKIEKDIKKIKDLTIIAFSDNKSEFFGNYIDNIKIVPPKEILNLQFDIIVITSIYVRIIKEQLSNLGIDKEKIVFWGDYWSSLVSGIRHIYYPKEEQNKDCKNALIISEKLNYNGGTIAAIYAGKALQKKGYNVTLASSDGNIKLIQECTDSGIIISICPSIPYIKNKEIEWIKEFDIVLVNVLNMMPCASIISNYKPVVWWIHESVGVDQLMVDKYREFLSFDKLSKVQICAVSKIPQKLFNSNMQDRVDSILCYGIPDKRKQQEYVKKTKKIIFAIIGAVCAIKGHDVFIRAINKLKSDKKKNAEFWIIGKENIDEFSQNILEIVFSEPTIKVLGEKTREEIEMLYSDIDVIVSASRADSFPIVMTEGMMYGKVCIASDATGISDYIEDGKNGFIVPCESIDALCERMEWIIDNQDHLSDIRKNARKTYEEYFTMEQFQMQLEKMFEEAKKKQKIDINNTL